MSATTVLAPACWSPSWSARPATACISRPRWPRWRAPWASRLVWRWASPPATSRPSATAARSSGRSPPTTCTRGLSCTSPTSAGCGSNRHRDAARPELRPGGGRRPRDSGCRRVRADSSAVEHATADLHRDPGAAGRGDARTRGRRRSRRRWRHSVDRALIGAVVLLLLLLPAILRSVRRGRRLRAVDTRLGEGRLDRAARHRRGPRLGDRPRADPEAVRRRSRRVGGRRGPPPARSAPWRPGARTLRTAPRCTLVRRRGRDPPQPPPRRRTGPHDHGDRGATVAPARPVVEGRTRTYRGPVRIRLFGGWAAEHDGAPLEVSGDRQRALLFRLALDPGTVVDVPRTLRGPVAGRPPREPAGRPAVAGRTAASPAARRGSRIRSWRVPPPRRPRGRGCGAVSPISSRPAPRTPLARRSSCWSGEPWSPGEGYDWFARDLATDRAEALRLAGERVAAGEAMPAPVTAMIGRSGRARSDP